MTLTLLLDLDDTLLNLNGEAFGQAYLSALSKELTPDRQPEAVLNALVSGRIRMNESRDFSRTLREVFDSDFFPHLNIPRGQLEPAIARFYEETFPQLQAFTSPISGAVDFVNWARSKGYRTAIATDPLLPRTAMLQRLRWAGFDPRDFEIVSSYECFHFSKSHPEYYAELLGRLGWPDGPILMVGNDIERDINPARRLGLAAFLVTGESASSAGSEPGLGGSLADLRLWLESADLKLMNPVLNSPDSILSILSATPAALSGLLFGLAPAAWTEKHNDDNWSLTELICHLRDIERDVHQANLKLLLEKEGAFIPRPDTSIWANQRDYLHEDGRSALKTYFDFRRETLAMLTKLPESGWQTNARHAIFGPTNLLEMVSFIAEHDRLHLHQAWAILNEK